MPGKLVDETGGPTRVIRYPSFGRPRGLVFKVIRSAFQSICSIPVGLIAGRQDVVIATVPALSTLVSGYVLSRFLRAHLVIDLRDSWPNLLSESNILRYSRFEPFFTALIINILRRAELVTVVTQGLGEVVESQGATQVAVIPNGVDIEGYRQSVSKQAVHDGTLHVLYLGNIGLSQGLELLVRAAAELPTQIRVRIVGDGSERSELQALALSLGAPVEFLHTVRGDGVINQYSWADTCVVSLRPDWASFSHTIPSKLYELLLLDRHITGLVRGEAARIIEESNGGTVVNQDRDSLVRHFRSLAARKESLNHSGSGPQWVAKYASLADLGEQYLCELTELAEKTK